MKIDYINHMGDDLMVVDAARVSFDKKSELGPDGILQEKDVKLIQYLAKNNHWSPFSHAQIQLRVTVPIFVANQIKRSVVGFSINEVSRRYIDSEPDFFIPSEWRGRPPKSLKQGSGDEIIVDIDESAMIGEFAEWIQLNNYKCNNIDFHYRRVLKTCKDFYQTLINTGVAPEMARMVLPLSLNTSWIWTGSLYAFARVCNQRLDAHAQKESRDIAKQISDIIKPLFPVSWSVLVPLS